MTTTSIQSAYRRHIKVTAATEDRDGIALAQQTVGAANLTLAGILVSSGTYTAGDGSGGRVGHQVSAYSAGNIATVTFTVYGTDPDGQTITDTITGVSNSTVETTKYFYTVTRVAANGAVGSDVEIGIVDELATQMIPIEPRASGWNVGLGVTVTGTISVTAQLTMDDIYDSSVTPAWIADTTLATKTATFYSALGVLVTAVRFVTNSYSTGAISTFHVLQNK